MLDQIFRNLDVDNSGHIGFDEVSARESYTWMEALLRIDLLHSMSPCPIDCRCSPGSLILSLSKGVVQALDGSSFTHDLLYCR